MAEQESNFVALDEAADVLDGFRRTVGVIQRNVVALATVDSTPVIDGLHVGQYAPTYEPNRGCGAAKGEYAADPDFGCSDTRSIGSERGRTQCQN